MHHELTAVSSHAHLDRSAGSIVFVREISTTHTVRPYVERLEAAFGGTPEAYFPIHANRTQLGEIEPQDAVLFSAEPLHRAQETMVDETRPLAIGKWISRDNDSRVLALFIQPQKDMFARLDVAWDDASNAWQILSETPITTQDVDTELRQNLDSVLPLS